ncbi:LytR/AlgR family response regulator transcription factor [Flavobacterium aciduliphilum]|uniref:LytTR family two component transcriptional regulator n=1 Tax=Flavobacterium aciduliphilum TaxID=1101402 RepID=A0A328YDB7_9FLAO|nr:LytTR family DNA-binding domain-containing protein [Flavobacterium aciduliphilum]RAR70102.1 LytTR family two component transcriptional regulator [Flavobacterium aciduliphilum]
MKIVIIEDEKPAARLLQRKLEKLGWHVSQLLHSVQEAVAWFSEHRHPDLIFLDIQLSDGLSFEIFDKIPIQSAVIFTTAYDEYALRAFKLNSIDYLLKPIDDQELECAIKKYQSIATSKINMPLDFEAIKQMFLQSTQKVYKKRFSIKIGNQLKMIPIEDIECFFSENKGTYIHTFENRDYLIEYTLEQLESEVDATTFFRVSRKYLISLHAIREIQLHSNSRLKVQLKSFSEDEIIVSREKVHDFKNWLN